MTAEFLKSAAITNDDAIPRVPNKSLIDNGIVRVSRGFNTVTSGATSGSTYAGVRVPSACRVISVRVTNPAGSASSAMDCGVYRTAQDTSAAAVGGTAINTVVDQDFFATAVAMTNANVDLDITGESTTYTNAKREQPLWQAAGMTSDPGGTLEICMTNTATNAAAFAVGLEVEWTI